MSENVFQPLIGGSCTAMMSRTGVSVGEGAFPWGIVVEWSQEPFPSSVLLCTTAPMVSSS